VNDPRSDTALASIAELTELKGRLARARPTLVRRPVAEIADALGRVGERFADPEDPVRQAALRELPGEAALSPELAEAVLDGMAVDWTRERITELLSAEFGEPAVLDGVVESRRGLGEASPSRQLMAFGPALCVQISSGGVPGVGVNAVIRSLLVKAPTLIKPGAGDVVLTRLFVEALSKEDPELWSAVAMRYWSGSERALTEAAVEGADLIVAYGSDEAVAAIRTLVPVTSRFVAYHHRFGVGVVGRDALGEGVEVVARDVASAVAMFEHRGCVCPHVVFVEHGGDVVPERFAELVADGLPGLAAEWPAPAEPNLASDEAAALRQARDTVEIQEAAGAARLWHGGTANWTVVFESGLADAPPLPGRSVRIRAVDDLSDVPAILGPAGRHLQSVGYAGAGDRFKELAGAFGRVGASRVVPFGRMSFPPAWWLHDGRGPLETLVRWVEVE